jgi:O-acetyl-ADP-ribose deacetylase (regulator of RNase III)
MTGSSKAFYKSRVAARLVKEYRCLIVDGADRTLAPSATAPLAREKNQHNNHRTGTFSPPVAAAPPGMRTVQVWHTSCIVTDFSAATTTTTNPSHRSLNTKRVLVNPANPELTGCARFPYFPRGGPVPAAPITSTVHRDWQPLGHVSEWGGMEVGNGMLFPVSVVDGLVHQLGGWQLQAEIKYLQLSASFFSISSSSPLPTPCPIGTAVATTAGTATSPLRQHYDAIIHTAPPFYQHPSSSADNNDNNGPAIPNSEWYQLRSCYESTLALLRDECRIQPVVAAVPLLGAGARGFPAAIATQVAASAVAAWLRQEQAQQERGYERDDREPKRPVGDDDDTTHHHHHPIVIAFGLLEAELADELCHALEENGVV